MFLLSSIKPASVSIEAVTIFIVEPGSYQSVTAKFRIVSRLVILPDSLRLKSGLLTSPKTSPVFGFITITVMYFDSSSSSASADSSSIIC